MQQFIQCYRCGAQNYMGQRACWHCQSKIQYNCTSCRAPIESTMANCPYCNMKLNFQLPAQPQYQNVQPNSGTHEQQPGKKGMSTWNQIELVSGILSLALGIFGSIMSMKDYGYIQPRLYVALAYGVGIIIYVVIARKK